MRVQPNPRPSHHSHANPPHVLAQHVAAHPARPQPVRRSTNDTTYRLFTTLLDPVEAPAIDLAVAYVRHWEIEGAFDELKTHQRGARTVLRSKSPELVLQEIRGHLCCHAAIRTLMWEAADHLTTRLR